jgi:hypothetical protein
VGLIPIPAGSGSPATSTVNARFYDVIGNQPISGPDPEWQILDYAALGSPEPCQETCTAILFGVELCVRRGQSGLGHRGSLCKKELSRALSDPLAFGAFWELQCSRVQLGIEF